MAAYFWVGGSGTWSGTGNTQFAITSGGTPTILNPTSADTVTFDANSGTAATVTVTATAVSLNTTINKADINISLSGSPTLCTSAGVLTFTTGTITLNNFILTTGLLTATTSAVRAISFGTGNITCTGNNVFVWNFANLDTTTFTGTPVVNFTYSGATGTRSIRHGNSSGLTEARAVSFNISAGTDIISILGGPKNLTFTGFAGTMTNTAQTIYGNLVISTGMTLTAGTSGFTFAATSGTQQITSNNKTFDFPVTQNGVGGIVQLQDNLTMGASRTYTLTNGTLDLNSKILNTGLFSSSNANTRSIAFNTGNITLTGNAAIIWDSTTATGFSYTGTSTINCTYSGSVGTRTIKSNSSTGGNETNALSFNISAGSDIVTLTAGGTNAFKNLNFTGFSGSLGTVASANNIYGNLTLSSTMSVATSAGSLTFSATSGTQQITTNTISIDRPITFNGIGGTFAFQDALTQGSTQTFTITNGTVQLKSGVTSTVGAFATSGTNQKYLQSTLAGTQATLTQATGTVNASYLTIKDINAIGGATWLAYTDQSNIDAGNVDGWNFGISPVVGGAEYTYRLRSFTQPRRF